MNDIRVLGVDPGFANFGYSEVRLLPEGEEVISLGVIRTKKSRAKRNVLAADDNLVRGQAISTELLRILRRAVAPVRAIFAESMSYPPNASAAAKMSISWGILAALSVVLGIPIVQVSPQQIKKEVCGNNKASKGEIQAELTKRYPHPLELLNDLPPSLYEHAYDALGAMAASRNSDVFLMARRMVT